MENGSYMGCSLLKEGKELATETGFYKLKFRAWLEENMAKKDWSKKRTGRSIGMPSGDVPLLVSEKSPCAAILCTGASEAV